MQGSDRLSAVNLYIPYRAKVKSADASDAVEVRNIQTTSDTDQNVDP